MIRKFDEIIVESIEDEFDGVDCPDPNKEIIKLKKNLERRKKFIRLRNIVSMCAVIVFVPLILFVYTNKEPEKPYSSNIILEKTKESLINESSIIVYGVVSEINYVKGNDSLKDVEVEVKRIFKGIPNNSAINVRVDDIDFEVNEKVIVFLVPKEKNNNYYTLVGANLGKYTMIDDERKIFTNYDLSEEIKLSSFENEVLE